MNRAFSLVTVLAFALMLAPLAVAQQEPESVPQAGTAFENPSPHQPETAPPTASDIAAKSEHAAKLKAAHAECPCPMCPLNKDKTAALGESADFDDADQTHMIFMQTRVSTSDPGVILAMADELRLTEDQKQKLHDIQRESRKEVKEVLNEEQRQMLSGLPQDEFSWRNMHDDMMAGQTSAGDPRSPAGDVEPDPGPEKSIDR